MAIQINNNHCPFCNTGNFVKQEIGESGIFHYECSNCKTHIQNDMVTGDSKVISLVGARNSSKTNYMYFLLNSLEENSQFKNKFKIINNGIIHQKHRLNFKENNETLKKGKFIKNTQLGERDTLINKISRVGRGKFYLTLKDTAGEEFDDPVKIVKELPYVYNSDGIILLIDPVQFSEIQEVLSLQGVNQSELLGTENKIVVQNLAEAIQMSIHNRQGTTPTPNVTFGGFRIPPLRDMLPRSGEKKIDIPIAVCITKFDLMLSIRDYHIPNIDYFLSDDYSEGEDALQKIRDKSDTLRKILLGLTNSIIPHIEDVFSNVAYFPIILAKPLPPDGKRFDIDDMHNFNRGVLTPLIWLLKKKNFI